MPTIVAREHPGTPGRRVVVHTGCGLPIFRCDEAQPHRRIVGHVLAQRLRAPWHVEGHRMCRAAIAEAPVDRRLRGPQDRERLLPAVADVVQLVAHHAAQDAAAAIHRQYADPAHAGSGNDRAGHGEIERERSRDAGDRVTVARGDRAARILHCAVALGELGIQRVTERVPVDLDNLRPLVFGEDPDGKRRRLHASCLPDAGRCRVTGPQPSAVHPVGRRRS